MEKSIYTIIGQLEGIATYHESIGNGLAAAMVREGVLALEQEYAANQQRCHKAEQYDTLVRELNVCDGGQYRNDVLSSIHNFLDNHERMQKMLNQIIECETDIQGPFTQCSPEDLDSPAMHIVRDIAQQLSQDIVRRSRK